jgi:hypothetical protein
MKPTYCFEPGNHYLTTLLSTDTEFSEGLNALGIDKFKVKLKNGMPKEVINEVSDEDEDKTISEGDYPAAMQNQVCSPSRVN